MRITKNIRKLTESITLKSHLRSVEDKIKRVRDEKEAAIDRMSATMSNDNFDTIEDRIGHMNKLDLQGDRNMGIASNARKQEGILLTQEAKIRLIRRLMLFSVIVSLGAFGEWVLPELGQDIKSEYYVALVQIYPVLLIACYLNDATANKTPYYNLKEYVDTKFTAFCITIIGIAVCLYAIAEKESSTLILMLTIASLLFMLKVLMDIIKQRH